MAMYDRSKLDPAQLAVIDTAWTTYREASKRIPHTTPWDLYLAADARLWETYLDAERRATR